MFISCRIVNFALIFSILCVSAENANAQNLNDKRKRAEGMLREQLDQLKKMKDAPACVRAVLIALEDPKVREIFLRKASNPCYVLKDICCLQFIRPLTHEFVLFNFDCAPRCFCLIDPHFRVDVNVASKKVVRIRNPYLGATKPCLSIRESRRAVLDTGNSRYKLTDPLPLKDLWATSSGVVFTLSKMPKGVRYFRADSNTNQKLSLLRDAFTRKLPVSVFYDDSIDSTTREGIEVRLRSPVVKTRSFDKQESTTIVLGSKNYVFTLGEDENPTIRVEKGARITIKLTSQQGRHDWVLADDDGEEEEVLAKTERTTPTGEPVMVTFTADRVGDHVYYCSVGSHRRRGMHGRFIVFDPENE